MYNPTHDIAEINRANVAQATKFAALSLDNAEKLMKFQLDTARAVFAQSVDSVHAAADVKDVQELIALRSKSAEAHTQTAMAYSRHLYDLATEAQAEYSALAEESFGVYSKGVAAFVDKASKSAPAGSDAAVNAFKSTLAATTAAFDQFQKASKQVASIADANVRAAAATASKAVKNGKRA